MALSHEIRPFSDAQTTAGLRAMLDWLQTEIGIEKVSNKLRDLIGLIVEEMLVEIKKQLPKKKGLSAAELQGIKQEHATTVVPLKENARRADQLEREVSDLVNEAFGLTPAEVKLMWDTAPPRMPFLAPAGMERQREAVAIPDHLR